MTIEQGTIIKLGKHRLMCGDCTKQEDVDKLLQDVKVDSLITDPPYGVDYGDKNRTLNRLYGGNRKEKSISNDNINDYYEFFKKVLQNTRPHLNDYNTCYIFMSGKQLHNLRLAFEDAGYYWSDYLAWVKNNHVLGRKDYKAKMEHILYGWFNHHKFYGGFRTNVLEYKRPYKNKLHPTMKPLPLLEQLITDGTPENGIVFDPFGGSGSTLIACEKMDRVCYIMEIDSDYCDTIIKRYNDYKKQAETQERLL